MLGMKFIMKKTSSNERTNLEAFKLLPRGIVDDVPVANDERGTRLVFPIDSNNVV
jgi:hypothetical protein